MMTNTEIAEQFTLLAQLMEISGDNPFKIKTYVNAAEIIEEYPENIIALTDDILYKIKGIGQAVGEKVRTLQHTGQIPQLEELRNAMPPGIVAMLQVKGLTPKKITTIWKQLEITTIDQLEEACMLNRIAPVKGFGDKTQAALLSAIQFYKRSLSFFRYSKAMPVATAILQKLQAALPNELFSFCGEYRRQMEVVAQVDILTTATIDQLTGIFSADPTLTVHIIPDHIVISQNGSVPVAIAHSIPTNNFYKTLFLETGEMEFLETFVSNYTIPENPISEEVIFTDNNLAFIPAAQREDATIITKAASGSLSKLIEVSDIRALIHAHSTYSDGKNTLEEMAKACMERGFEYMVITDHSQSAFYANGLKPEAIIAQHNEIALLNQQLGSFKIFKGIESDILNDGSLDYTDEILASFDVVIASVHSNLRMTESKATERLIKAISNPFTKILGHPTGRQLLIREGYPIDHKAVIDACIANKVVIEINANPRRLDLDWRWIDYALSNGALLSINPDAHTINGIDDIRYGVLAAQKGGLTAEKNLSSYSLESFEKFLSERHL